MLALRSSGSLYFVVMELLRVEVVMSISRRESESLRPPAPYTPKPTTITYLNLETFQNYVQVHDLYIRAVFF